MPVSSESRTPVFRMMPVAVKSRSAWGPAAGFFNRLQQGLDLVLRKVIRDVLVLNDSGIDYGIMINLTAILQPLEKGTQGSFGIGDGTGFARFAIMP